MPKKKRFYYFTPTKYALESIKNRRLKAAEMDKANDPYEFLSLKWNNTNDAETFIGFMLDLAEDLKMICLSETYRDVSLWGHYADRCRGICLGFDIDSHEDKEKSIISKIRYVRNRMDMSKFGFHYVDGVLKNTDNKAHNLRHYKSYHWKHEKEWA